MKIKRIDLMKAVQEHPELPKLVQAEKTGIHIPSLAAALARVESNYELGARVTDSAEDSIGLWQINRRFWDVEGDPTLENQIGWFFQVMRDAQKTITAAWGARQRGRDKVQYIPSTPQPSDFAVWYSVAWQWGSDDATKWLQNYTDQSIPGFMAYLEANKPNASKRAKAATRKRQETVQAEYKKAWKEWEANYVTVSDDLINPMVDDAEELAKKAGELVGDAAIAAKEMSPARVRGYVLLGAAIGLALLWGKLK